MLQNLNRQGGLDPDDHAAVVRAHFMLGRRPKPAQFDPRDGAFSERREEARHVPRVRRIVEAALADRLPEAEYPRVGGGGGRRRSSAGGAGDDDDGAGGDDDDEPALGSWGVLPNGSAKLADRQLIVIMLGGACHAEVRCMAELQEARPATHLFFGTTALLTPNAHLKALRRVPALPLLTPLGTSLLGAPPKAFGELQVQSV